MRKIGKNFKKICRMFENYAWNIWSKHMKNLQEYKKIIEEVREIYRKNRWLQWKIYEIIRWIFVHERISLFHFRIEYLQNLNVRIESTRVPVKRKRFAGRHKKSNCYIFPKHGIIWCSLYSNARCSIFTFSFSSLPSRSYFMENGREHPKILLILNLDSISNLVIPNVS